MLLLRVFISLCLLLLLLGGCAANLPDPMVDNSLDNPFESLKRYALEIRDEKRLIAKSRDMAARNKVSANAMAQYQKELFAELPHFEERVSIHITAQPHEIAKFIAVAAQYDFLPPLAQPLTPFTVTIHLENATLMEVLRSLNAKVGKLGVIQVHTHPRRVVNFEYRR